MRKYSISDIEKLTGLSTHSLRAWEKRYGFVMPNRTDSKIRYYTDDQLVTLINASFLLERGYKISAIADMSQKEISDRVLEFARDQNVAITDLVKLLATATLALDEDTIRAVIEDEISQSGFEATFLFLIYPFLQYLGVLWAAGKSLPAQEHFVSHLLAQRLNAELEEMSQGTKSPMIFALLDEEEHEIGLLLSCYLAKLRNIKCVYLSRKVPVENLQPVIELTNAKRIMTIFTIPPAEDTIVNLKSFLADSQTDLLYSGIKIDALDEQATFFANPQEFIDFLDQTS
ncbi:MerR family transcriptional regulator [Jiulongibacter sediminis]|uniref:HTH merR-type domain-containing protein n=1 Tax=Jiulongibacter sediminis TaxID=1605367 RepID=A0A0N8HAC8_9BACT|nr:MerR family transcriptional regulator [Jiulongibacter sediminis]KPM49812.1 hypothetical protein AFM12_04355 [Jiulongibacter sediminis]TBX26849.1 hypothetical protein TK44_04360 [Jiulongibacter sediminis]